MTHAELVAATARRLGETWQPGDVTDVIEVLCGLVGEQLRQGRSVSVLYLGEFKHRLVLCNVLPDSTPLLTPKLRLTRSLVRAGQIRLPNPNTAPSGGGRGEKAGDG
jgi:hypothetical protein